jgi:cation:H+ antiporter
MNLVQLEPVRILRILICFEEDPLGGARMNWIALLAGLGLLVIGAEMLVRGGASFAARMGISSLVIGLTIVAYGTSSPELIVSAKAALAGSPDIAIGNVVGSNIFNILFILGISALICPLAVSQQLVRIDVPIMIGVSVLTFILSLDGMLGKVDGIIFLTGIVLYTWFVISLGKKEKKKEVIKEYESEFGAPKKSKSWLLDIFLIAVGLGVLIFGARWFVGGAIGIARGFGISELVIALTIVAAGTSMPEVATSIMASIRKERDIAVGNVVGSNIYNILAILGISSILAKDGLPVSAGIIDFDMPAMIAVAVACLPIFFTGRTISRWEGGVFIFYYAAYTTYLILKSSEHDQLPMMSGAMMIFVIPLTVLTMTVIYFQTHFKIKRA